MTERPRPDSKTLAPYTDLMDAVEAAYRDMTEALSPAEMLALRDAIDTFTSTNCPAPHYEAVRFLWQLLPSRSYLQRLIEGTSDD